MTESFDSFKDLTSAIEGITAQLLALSYNNAGKKIEPLSDSDMLNSNSIITGSEVNESHRMETAPRGRVATHKSNNARRRGRSGPRKLRPVQKQPLSRGIPVEHDGEPGNVAYWENQMDKLQQHRSEIKQTITRLSTGLSSQGIRPEDPVLSCFFFHEATGINWLECEAQFPLPADHFRHIYTASNPLILTEEACFLHHASRFLQLYNNHHLSLAIDALLHVRFHRDSAIRTFLDRGYFESLEVCKRALSDYHHAWGR
jgi:hypothetical protein